MLALRDGVLKEEQSHHVAKKHRSGGIGIAISGGVDSMALAALYTQSRRKNTELPSAHGFIVDHRVRPESTEEAEWVASQLRLKCEIQHMVFAM